MTGRFNFQIDCFVDFLNKLHQYSIVLATEDSSFLSFLAFCFANTFLSAPDLYNPKP